MWLRITQHLLPRARAWRITAAKRLRDWFNGLSQWPNDVRSFTDLVLDDLWPSTTRELDEWERQFGVYPATTEGSRRTAIEAEWKANGGQGLDYIQSVIDAAGTGARVYSPWISLATLPPASQPLLWWRGDDRGAVQSLLHADASVSLMYLSADDAITVSGGVVTSIPNRGSLGGTGLSASGSGPSVSKSGKNQWFETTTNGGLQFGTTASLALLHQDGTIATAVMRVRVDNPAGDGRLINTRFVTLGAGVTGVMFRIFGSDIRLNVGNNGVDALALSGGADISAGEHVIALRKTGSLYEIFLDGALYLSGTAGALSTSPTSQRIPTFGSDLSDGGKLAGAIHHVTVYQSALSIEQINELGSMGPFFSSIPNIGTQGGSVLPSYGTGPQVTEQDGKFAPLTTVSGGFTYGTTASLRILHEPGTSATVLVAVRVDSAPENGLVLATQPGSASVLGVRIYYGTDRKPVLQVSNGSGTLALTLTSPVAIPAGMPTVLVVRKAGLQYSIAIGSSIVATGSASSLTAGPSNIAPLIGGSEVDTLRVRGAICEMAVLPYAMPDSDLIRVAQVMQRWSGGSGYVARDPRTIANQPLIGDVQCGEPLSLCGEDSATANSFLANEPHYIVNKTLQRTAPPAIPSDSSTWPHFLYIAGPEDPYHAFYLPAEKRDELERLILKVRPLDSWVVMRDVSEGYLITDTMDFLSTDDNGFLEVTPQ